MPVAASLTTTVNNIESCDRAVDGSGRLWTNGKDGSDERQAQSRLLRRSAASVEWASSATTTA